MMDFTTSKEGQAKITTSPTTTASKCQDLDCPSSSPKRSGMLRKNTSMHWVRNRAVRDFNYPHLNQMQLRPYCWSPQCEFLIYVPVRLGCKTVFDTESDKAAKQLHYKYRPCILNNILRKELRSGILFYILCQLCRSQICENLIKSL